MTSFLSTANVRFLMLCTLLFVSVFASKAWAENKPEQDSNKGLPIEEIRLFSQAFERIRGAYVEQIDDKTLLEYAISGMLSSLDPHSSYLKGEALDDLKDNTRGHFGGLGVEIEIDEGRLRVITPIDNSPAAKAGIRAGDIIIAIDEHRLVDISIMDALEKMRGETGSKAKVEIYRKGEKKPLVFDLVRAKIPLVSVRSKMFKPNIGYIRISQFQDNTFKELQRELKKLQSKHKVHALVLDLRNNPGGVLGAAVDVVDAFIKKGVIVSTKGRAANANTRFIARELVLIDSIPMVVLINGGSASASEIVAGALQDHKRAVILGTQSFGKGSVQTILPITESKAIKLTTARYFTPKDRSIQAKGITPDIYIEQSTVTPFAENYYKESDLPGHLKSEKKKTKKAKQKQADKNQNNELLKKDFQLYEAYTLLRGMNILGLKPKSESTKP